MFSQTYNIFFLFLMFTGQVAVFVRVAENLTSLRRTEVCRTAGFDAYTRLHETPGPVF